MVCRKDNPFFQANSSFAEARRAVSLKKKNQQTHQKCLQQSLGEPRRTLELWGMCVSEDHEMNAHSSALQWDVLPQSCRLSF